jgi:UDP-sulfoquinovose synthase
LDRKAPQCKPGGGQGVGGGKQLRLDVKINNVPYPRLEAEDHYYNPVHTGLLELGLKPHFLTEEVLTEMLEVALRYKGNIKEHAIFRGVKWK